MTMIRLATLDDVPAIVRLATQFIETTEYVAVLTVNPSQLEALTSALLEREDAAVWLADREGVVVGMLAVHVFAHPFSGQRLAGEICWFMATEARGGGDAVRLLSKAESWARQQKVEAMQLTAPNDRVGAFYERRGYCGIERAYYQRM